MNFDTRLAAAALLIAGAGGAAYAHPHAEGDGRSVERIVIVDGKDGETGSEGERVRRFEIHRHGKDGERHAHGPDVRRFEIHGPGPFALCEGGEKIVDETAEADDKTRVLICTKGAPTAATAKHLEDSLARIRTNDHLSDEQKARIETALRSAIDRARGAR